MTMLTEPATGSETALAGSLALPGDYLELLKPRVMSLVVFTALTGLVVAPGHVNLVVAAARLLAPPVGGGAAGAGNMAYEADLDAVMTRTKGRPIPTGRVTTAEAFAFGGVLAVFSVMLIGLAANWLAAALLAFTIFFYAGIYTVWLKRLTPHNIVIGGAAGALPPVIGYAIVTNGVAPESLILFAVIFVWTPPHFWALALLRSDDYARAGIPMMPNVRGASRTRLEILLYTLVLAPLGVVPWAMGLGGPAYGVLSAATGAVMLFLAWRCYRRRTGEAAETAAKHLFGFSILYLFLLFAELLAEHGLALASRHWW